jgi:trk system potassium uptake protein TrkA
MYIIIVGGGQVGYYLTKTLLSEEHEVLLIEKDVAQAAALKAELGDDIVKQGDGSEMRVLQEIGLNRADVIVAATGADEDNLVVCQMAKKKFNVPKTIARVNDPRNEELFQHMGIDTTVSSTTLIHHSIAQEITADSVLPLAVLKKSNVEIVQATLAETSPIANKYIRDLTLPKNCMFILVIREEQVILPLGGTLLLPNDLVIVLVSMEGEQELRNALKGNA